jgi:hypothetical protein
MHCKNFLFVKDSSTKSNFDAVAMFPFARWITPTTFTERFDTEFLIMLADRCAPIRACSKVRTFFLNFCCFFSQEMERIEWLRPAEIIMKSIKGELQLPPPQIYELSRLQSIDFEDGN